MLGFCQVLFLSCRFSSVRFNLPDFWFSRYMRSTKLLNFHAVEYIIPHTNSHSVHIYPQLSLRAHIPNSHSARTSPLSLRAYANSHSVHISPTLTPCIYLQLRAYIPRLLLRAHSAHATRTYSHSARTLHTPPAPTLTPRALRTRHPHFISTARTINIQSRTPRAPYHLPTRWRPPLQWTRSASYHR